MCVAGFCSCCCPCVTVGQSIEITTNGALGCGAAALITFFLDAISAFTLARFFTMKYRRELRQSYQLPPTCWGVLPPAVDDCIAHTFCWQCALAQEARELKNRGWDPSISKVLRQKSIDASLASLYEGVGAAHAANVACFQFRAQMEHPSLEEMEE